MAQGLFLGGTGRRAVAHTRPEFVKNTLGPFGIPLVRGASGLRRRAMNPTPQITGEGYPVKVIRYLMHAPPGGKAPWGRRKNLQVPRHTWGEGGQIRAADNTAGRSATRHLERFRSRVICGIWCTPHLTGMYGTRPFFGWDRAQGRSPHAPGVCQKYPRPLRHSPC